MILICHTSHEGHTATLAQRAGEACRAQGFGVRIVHLHKEHPDMQDLEGALVLASIHMGAHDKALVSWVREHAEALQAVPGAVVSVSLSAESGDATREQEAGGYLSAFLEQTGWRPGRALSARGGIHLKKMNWFMRFFFKKLVRDQGLATDEDGNADYTDLEAFDRFVDAFLGDVRAHRGAEGSPQTAT